MILKDTFLRINPDAKGVDSVTRSTYTTDTLEVAREKVAVKSETAKQFVLSDFAEVRGKKPDVTFIHAPHKGGFFVGAKYGNRWLKNIIDEDPFWGPLNKEQLIEALGAFSTAARNGELDEQIKAAMKR